MLSCWQCEPRHLLDHDLVFSAAKVLNKTSRRAHYRKVAMDAEDANLAARGFHRYTSKKYEKVGGVLEVEWVQDLMRQKDTSSVLTAGAMVSKDSLLPIDHMVFPCTALQPRMHPSFALKKAWPRLCTWASEFSPLDPVLYRVAIWLDIRMAHKRLSTIVRQLLTCLLHAVYSLPEGGIDQ